ncbi:MAG TPA: hypothetical protein VN973_04655 [Candidatus Dormibacteraeota bacterium]|nr:hypothetical protein [Candidatus Dormibacteraeota bacterium]
MRRAGAACSVISAIAFVVGIIALLQAEGPSSPDLLVYLASPSGQSDFLLAVDALTVAVVLFMAGTVVVCWTIGAERRLHAVLVGALVVAAVPAFIGFLSLQFALVGTLREGIDPNSVTFKAQVLQAHAAADWAGWTGIVMMSVALLLIGAALFADPRRRLATWTAIACGVLGIILVPIGFGFLFTLLLAVWQLVAAADLVLFGGTPRRPSVAATEGTAG